MSRTKNLLSAAGTSTYYNSSNTNNFVVSNLSGSALISGGSDSVNRNSVLLAGSGRTNPVLGSFGTFNSGTALQLQTKVTNFPLIQESTHHYTVQTTNYTYVTLALMSCPAETGVYYFDIDIKALCTSGTYLGGGYDGELRLAVKNTSGTLSYLTEYESVNPYLVEHYKSNTSWVPQVPLTSNNVKLEVIGDLDELTYWQASAKRSSITPI